MDFILQRGKRKASEDITNELEEVTIPKVEQQSSKWISVKSSKLAVNSSIQNSVFKKCGNDCVNLISVFGAARQGKSFLMNCLADQTGLFQISNQRESCTQGIDISPHTMDISTFSQVDGGKAVTLPKNSRKVKVGFVDAEGQGDRDVTYDANLVCPILLASKCVIFNWKDSMQKDRILNLLGIMHKAAINVATDGDFETESGDSGRVFGHLHLVFRDWQYKGSTEKDVMADIFKEERSAEPAAAVRNQIRRSVKESFESIHVWLFPAPVEDASKLSTELNFNITSTAFRSKIREFRFKLAEQLVVPMKFDNKVLTGRMIGPMVSTIADLLNSGDSIRPASAYVSMMRAEVEQLKTQFEVELKNMTQSLLDNIQQQYITSSTSTSTKAIKITITQFPTQSEAIHQYQLQLDELMVLYKENVMHCVGELEGAVADQVLSVTNDAITRLTNDMKDFFLTSFSRLFSQWLRLARQDAEKEVDKSVKNIENTLLPMDTQELEGLLVVIFKEYKEMLQTAKSGSKAVSDINEADEALNQYDKHCNNISMVIKQMNDQALLALKIEIEGYLSESIKYMQNCLNRTIDRIKSLTFESTGAIIILHTHREDLNKEYFKAENNLLDKISNLRMGEAFAGDIKLSFMEECKKMKMVLDEEYNKKAINILKNAYDNICNNLELEVESLLNDHTSTPFENDSLTDRFHTIAEELLSQVTDNISEWTISNTILQTHLTTPWENFIQNKLKNLLFTNSKLLEIQKQQKELQLEIQRQQEELLLQREIEAEKNKKNTADALAAAAASKIASRLTKTKKTTPDDNRTENDDHNKPTARRITPLKKMKSSTTATTSSRRKSTTTSTSTSPVHGNVRTSQSVDVEAGRLKAKAWALKQSEDKRAAALAAAQQEAEEAAAANATAPGAKKGRKSVGAAAAAGRRSSVVDGEARLVAARETERQRIKDRADAKERELLGNGNDDGSSSNNGDENKKDGGGKGGGGSSKRGRRRSVL
eukprot:gene10551-22004_t